MFLIFLIISFDVCIFLFCTHGVWHCTIHLCPQFISHLTLRLLAFRMYMFLFYFVFIYLFFDQDLHIFTL